MRAAFIYDEVPDRQRLFDEADRICRQIYLRAKQQVLYLYNSGHTFLTVNSADEDADTEGTKDSGRYKDMIL